MKYTACLLLLCFPAAPAAFSADGGATALGQLKAAPAASEARPAPEAAGPLPARAPDFVPGSFAAQADQAYRGLPNYLTMHAAPPPRPIDWLTLRTLGASVLRNFYEVAFEGQTHSIGHISFEVGCTLPDGSRESLVTGQSVKNLAEFARQLGRGDGYAAFFGHVEGVMQTKEGLEREYDALSGREGELSLMTFKLSPEACREALRYVRAYVQEGVYKRYGLGVRPLYKEGGGCANVGVSVLQVAGPAGFAELAAPWSRTLYLPARMFGSAGHPVGIWDAVEQLDYKWQEKTAAPHKELFFYDPEPMHYWILAAHAAGYAASAGRPVERYRVNKAPGVILDYSSASRPTSWWLRD
jgi:hypothetical protein